jgi:hypothetical protein
MKPKKDSFDKWFNEHVQVIGMDKGKANKKVKSIIREQVKEKLIKQVKKENK